VIRHEAARGCYAFITMTRLDDRNPERAAQVITARRANDLLETIVSWLESLAAHARRSWLDRRARMPLRPPR
jgi:hypothetical protein